MKKMFIVSACALSLCLTSCASKKAPTPSNQSKAPQAETAEALEQEETENTDAGDDTAENNNSTSEGNTEATSEEESEELESFGAELVNSEDFPAPEEISEPEIITLEPVEKITETAEEPEAEQVVVEEEPPVIYETENSETAASESELKKTESEKAEANEHENSEPEVTLQADNDIVIEEAGASVSSDDGVVSIGGGIDITEDVSSDDADSKNIPAIIPSRSVTLKKFEYLDVTYPGTGWIYMGLTDNSKDLAYFGRKLGTKDTKFSLQARAAGTKIIHFYRNDPLSGHYLDDYIEVIILAENGSNKTHVEAPEYKLPVQKNEEPAEETEVQTEETEETAQEKSTSEKPAAQTSEKTTTQNQTKTETTAATKTTNTTAATTTTAATKTTTDTSTATSSTKTSTAETSSTEATETTAATTKTSETTQTTATPATLLQEAQLLYNEKEYAAALAKLNLFFELSTDNRDEALYLKGQILEAKSEVRDIKGAIDAYTSLTKNYPASKLWDSANKRIIYLRRFYMEVR